MFARSHGPAADHRPTIVSLFGLLCLIATQPGLANPPASLLSGPADAVIGQPVRTILAADADQTVVQITFPVAVAPPDWRAVRKVAWAEIPTEYFDRHTETIEAIEAAYGFHVAVAGRTAPDWRVAAVQWYREPADPTAPVAMVLAPSIHRGVPLATATVYPEAGEGILAGLILEVRHPAPSGLKQARDSSPAGRRAAAEPLPGSVVNPEHYRQLRAWSTDQPQPAAKRDLGPRLPVGGQEDGAVGRIEALHLDAEQVEPRRGLPHRPSHEDQVAGPRRGAEDRSGSPPDRGHAEE